VTENHTITGNLGHAIGLVFARFSGGEWVRKFVAFHISVADFNDFDVTNLEQPIFTVRILEFNLR